MANQIATLSTVGHGDRTWDEMLALLKEAGIGRVVDVRSYPQSRRFPWFGRERLDAALEAAGIDYVWMGRELGGKRSRKPEQTRLHPALSPGMAAFAEQMTSPGFARALGNVRAMSGGTAGGAAVLCAERDPAQCHRHLISDYLQLIEHVEVVHWLDPGRSRLHENHPAARVASDGTLRYDRGHTVSLWT